MSADWINADETGLTMLAPRDIIKAMRISKKVRILMGVTPHGVTLNLAYIIVVKSKS